MAAQAPEETAISESVSPLAPPLNRRPIGNSQGGCMLFTQHSAWPESKTGGAEGEIKRQRWRECEEEEERLYFQSEAMYTQAA